MPKLFSKYLLLVLSYIRAPIFEMFGISSISSWSSRALLLSLFTKILDPSVSTFEHSEQCEFCVHLNSLAASAVYRLYSSPSSRQWRHFSKLAFSYYLPLLYLLSLAWSSMPELYTTLAIAKQTAAWSWQRASRQHLVSWRATFRRPVVLIYATIPPRSVSTPGLGPTME